MLTKEARKILLVGFESIDRNVFSQNGLDENVQNRIASLSFFLKRAFSSSRFYLKEDLNRFLVQPEMLSFVGERACYSIDFDVENSELNVTYEGTDCVLKVSTFEPNYLYSKFKKISWESDFIEGVQFKNIVNDPILDLIAKKMFSQGESFVENILLYRRTYTFKDSSVSFYVTYNQKNGLDIKYSTSNKNKSFSDSKLRYLSNHMFPVLFSMKGFKEFYSSNNTNVFEMFDKTMLKILSPEFELNQKD